MQLSFDHLAIRNFKSFVSAKPINFDLAARGNGVHFIRGRNYRKRLGSNGAGKSSFIGDAITWCLYGVTSGGLKNPDVKPWSGEKPTAVAVTLRVNGKKCVIARTISPNKLTIDDETVGQEQVDALVGLTSEVFNHTVLLGQGRPLFFDLSPRHKMDLFSDVLALERWEARSKLASERVSCFQTERDRAEGQLAALSTQYDQLTSQLNGFKLASREWENKRQVRIGDMDAEIVNLTKVIGRMQGEVDDADLAYDSAGMQLKQIEADLLEANSTLDKVGKVFDASAAVAKSASIMITELRRELSAMKVGTECPTCKREFTAKSHEATRNKLRERIAKFEKNLEVDDRLVTQYDSLHSLVTRLEHAAQEFREKANEARDILDLKRPSLDAIKAKLAGLKERKQHGNEEDNPISAILAITRKNRADAARDRDALADEIALLGRRIERAKFWVKGFRDVRLYVVDEVLQELQLTTNAALEEVGLSGWEIQYSVERETKSGSIQQGLNVSILSPKNDKPVKWESWSGGESQRLRLVGALALSEVLLAHAGVTTNMEILDEPTQHLSPEGVRDVCDYLVDRARQYERQTFYIDHTSVESTRFASVITVVKDRDGSYIE